MGDVFKNQSVTLTVETYTDLSTSTTSNIKLFKPDRTELEFVGSVIDTTKIRYAIPENVLDQSGMWYIHASVIFSGQTVPSIGERTHLYVSDIFQGL